jgi:tetratricopeptide (TPR) repeat protein
MRLAIVTSPFLLLLCTAAGATNAELDRTLALANHENAHLHSRQAAYYYKVALRYDPKNEPAWNGLVQNLVMLEDQKAAIREANAGLRQIPKSAELYFQRSKACYGLNDYKGAISDASKACELDPAEPLYPQKLAEYETVLGKNSDAIKDYTLCLAVCKKEMDAKGPQAQNFALTYELSLKERGNCYKAIGKYQEAINDYSALLKLPVVDFHPVKVLRERADCYDKLGKHDLAAKDRKNAEAQSHTVLDDLMKP